MDKETVISKIQKLYSLGESSNENEAQAAIAKARQLMAQYHIEVSELNMGHPDEEADSQECEDIRFTKRNGWWKMLVAKVIAEHMSCKVAFSQTAYGSKTYTVLLFGFPEDMTICRMTIDYAIASVQAIAGVRSRGYQSTKIRRIIENSVGFGFMQGLEEHYKKQDKEEGWGLVLTTPEAVQKRFDDETEISHAHASQDYIDPSAYSAGYRAGSSFGTTERIEAE